MPEDAETQTSIEQIEGLVRQAKNISDPIARSLSTQLIQSLMALHGAAFERMLEIVHSSGEVGQRAIEEMSRDELVRSLLLLYGLHPVDLRTRISEAVEKAAPNIRSQEGRIESYELSESGVVTLQIAANSHGCRSSAAHLQSLIEQAIYEAAPDVAGIVFEGSEDEATQVGFVPLADLQNATTFSAGGSDSQAESKANDEQHLAPAAPSPAWSST